MSFYEMKGYEKPEKEYYCVRECVFNVNYWYPDTFNTVRKLVSGLREGIDVQQPISDYMIPVEGKVTAKQRQLMDTRRKDLEGNIRKLEFAQRSGKVRGAETAMKQALDLLERIKTIGVEVAKSEIEPEEKMPDLTEAQRKQIYKEMQGEQKKVGKLKPKPA